MTVSDKDQESCMCSTSADLTVHLQLKEGLKNISLKTIGRTDKTEARMTESMSHGFRREDRGLFPRLSL